MSTKRQKTEHSRDSILQMSGNSAANEHNRSEFYGQGIQNTGYGDINVGRDVNIRSRGIDTTLQKVRLTDPRDDKTRIEQQKGGLLHDSYKWILGHKDFQRLRDGEGYQLLWIRGDPGKGKTMLLCGIVDELHKAGMKDRNVVYYFCQATNEKLNKATSVLCGLIYSLLSQRRGLLETVREDIDEASGEMFQDLNAWAALCRIFGRLMEETERHRQTTYLIVDALDECLEGRHNLLKWIADLSSSHIKVLVSSRNWPSIESGLSSATHRVLLQLELNDDSISNAVDCYIDYKATELEKSKKLNQVDREAIRQHLKSNSGNTFLWVALVCQGLGHEDTSTWKVFDVLHKFPSGLNSLYGRMAMQFLAGEDAEMCRQVLAVQALACRPLRLTELLPHIETPKGFPRTAIRLKEVIELCGSFLTVRDGTVYFVHQSAKDYLIEHKSDSIFPLGNLSEHHTIAIQLIQELSRALQENIYKLPSPGFRIDSIDVPNPDPLDGVRYACVYWADHLENAKHMGEQDLEDGGLVHRFLEKHLLHWLEALSLLRNLGSGIEALTKVLSLLQDSKKAENDLDKLVYDAVRFSRHHKIAIETAPLQVYSSALVFSPTNSVVRKLFLKKPEWLLMSPTRDSGWNSCLQTLEGHTQLITSVVFSPDGKRVASSSSDYTVRIWDVATGGCLNILKGHDLNIKSVTFSPNGECVASISWRGQVRVWDVTTGACLKTFESRNDSNGDDGNIDYWLVAFPDDKSVRSFSNCDRVCTWDIATGTLLGTVRVVDFVRSPWASANRLCLSRNGRRAAWVSPVWSLYKSKSRIQVVDIVASQNYETPWYLDISDVPHYQALVALSSDGEYLAIMTEKYQSGNNGHHFEFDIWNVETNKCIQTLHCFWDDVPGVLRLSPDKKYLAAASPNHKVEWEIATGQQVIFTGKIEDRGWLNTKSLDFSPDSRLLPASNTKISGKPGLDDDNDNNDNNDDNNDDNDDNDDDKDDRDDRDDSDDDGDGVAYYPRSLTLSSDGKLLGFLGRNRTFQIWDTMKNRLLSKVRTKSLEPGVAFSPDNKYLACTWYTYPVGISAISLFDTTTGRRLWESEARIGLLCNGDSGRQVVDFSADGRQLATGFQGCGHSEGPWNAVRILDVVTGTCLGKVKVSGYQPYRDDKHNKLSLALSPEGTKVAIIFQPVNYGDYDKRLLHEVRIWDVATASHMCSVPLREFTDGGTDDIDVAFSPDSRNLVCRGRFGKTFILEARTGDCIKVLNGFYDDLFEMTWSTRWGPAGLLTSRGIYCTQALLEDDRKTITYGRDNIPTGALSGLGVNPARDWILRNGEPYLWVPPEHRTPYLSQDVDGNTIAFGRTTDHIYCIRLSSLN
ncbi:hypothetical protein NUW58_g7431 [Xylaria curta]|uniref:Uncharacterized protein n=1 Tax=Xylaria curta TaxID=42375 RepID=A0ACC1NI97_9PEZI|nr:hypothetical protein NUW58_g7431 [Xylaria curta]